MPFFEGIVLKKNVPNNSSGCVLQIPQCHVKRVNLIFPINNFMKWWFVGFKGYVLEIP